MDILTKLEELILLTVWRLKDDAYGISIYKYIQKVTDKKMAIGSVYFPLDRLTKRGLLSAYKGEPTKKRGGMSKKYYELTTEGQKVLEATRKINETMWNGYSEFSQNITKL